MGHVVQTGVPVSMLFVWCGVVSVSVAMYGWLSVGLIRGFQTLPSTNKPPSQHAIEKRTTMPPHYTRVHFATPMANSRPSKREGRS